MRHLMSPLDFSVEELDKLLDLAQDIEAHREKYAHACDGKKLATLFYEPSTRTRLSHEAAMLNLAAASWAFFFRGFQFRSKGRERIRYHPHDFLLRGYLRHAPSQGGRAHGRLPALFHPCDQRGRRRTSAPDPDADRPSDDPEPEGASRNMTIGLCGDLKFGRTVHSLINALVRYEGIRFILISPEELRLPEYIRHDVLDRGNVPYEEVVRLEDAMPKLDILYMTRVQKERFFNEEDYVRMKDFYILDKAKMKLAPEDMYVLHPLPRVNEISVEVDDDPEGPRISARYSTASTSGWR